MAALSLVLGATTALWTPSWVVDAPTLGWLTVLSVPIALPWLLPVSAAAGVVGALSRWQREGAWTGVRASGGRLATLIPAALVVGILAGGLTGVAEHWLAPHARSAIRRAVGNPVERVTLWPGRTVDLGGLTLRADAMDGDWARGVVLATDTLLGTAQRARVVSTTAGAHLELVDGAVIGGDSTPWRLTFAQWSRPIALPAVRVELAERTTADLHRAASRTEAAGGDAAYEWAVWAKRWFHPLSAFLLPIAVLPVGLERHPWRALGALAVGYALFVRLGDLAAAAAGPTVAAAAGPLFIGVMGVVLWLRQRRM